MLYLGDCREVLRGVAKNSVDMVITSPPYDNLRDYGGSLDWSFEVFKSVAENLTRVLKPGGVYSVDSL